MSDKQSRRQRKGTRPFMPLHGHRPVPHKGAEASEPDTVMHVGADAMIDDVNTQSDEQRLRAAHGLPQNDAAPQQEAANDTAGDAPAEAASGKGNPTLEQVMAERDAYLDLARRERADFDNYRKRVEREKQQLKRESLASFLKEFFAPLDDMDRVLAESVKNHSFESLVTGVRIMEENFWRVLAKAGVRKIDAMGKNFDPALHEAMTTVPTDEVPPNTVVEVFDNGYKLDDFILRPARVVVSRAPDA
ncbi:MAG: nucleotide exchange factor GrpE [Planctomycetaceae bacterium]|nr:nucleotide exchange factor GrpE [Planctomycetaceae bacterium]